MSTKTDFNTLETFLNNESPKSIALDHSPIRTSAYILLAAAGGASSSLGQAFQARAAHSLPVGPSTELDFTKPLRCIENIKTKFLSNEIFLRGLIMDIGGAIAVVIAMAHAPVSVIQPVASCGLAVLAVYAHHYMKV